MKGYAKHERDTFEEVTKARSGALAAQAPPSIQQFPAVLVANSFHFEPRQHFDAPSDAEATSEVSLAR